MWRQQRLADRGKSYSNGRQLGRRATDDCQKQRAGLQAVNGGSAELAIWFDGDGIGCEHMDDVGIVDTRQGHANEIEKEETNEDDIAQKMP